MKRFLLIIIFIIIIRITIYIPEYVELNNLIIVDSIGVKCNEKSYTIYIKEIIPKKEDTGIKYNYKLYEDTNYSLKSTFNNIKNKTNKKIYLNDTKYIITNCDKSSKIINYFKINPKYIKHTKNKRELKLKEN